MQIAAEQVAIFGLLITALGVWITAMQIRSDRRWDRKKTSHEVLNTLAAGEFVVVIEKIHADFGWDIVGGGKAYQIETERMTAEQREQLEILLRRAFRFLESICISMQHGIIDERICREYVSDIMIKMFKKNQSFVQEQRRLRNEATVFKWVEHYATKWHRETTGPIARPVLSNASALVEPSEDGSS